MKITPKQIAPFVGLAILITGTTGCTTTLKDRVLDINSQSQLQKRSYQARKFDISDQKRVLRATISTLQDLGFVIDKADLILGIVSATKLEDYQLTITVSVRQTGKKETIVRASAQFNLRPVEDPKAYQDFFSSLEKSLFLQAQNLD